MAIYDDAARDGWCVDCNIVYRLRRYAANEEYREIDARSLCKEAAEIIESERRQAIRKDAIPWEIIDGLLIGYNPKSWIDAGAAQELLKTILAARPDQ